MATSSSLLNNSHIIYVEDDPSMQELMYEILKDDFNIHVTGSADKVFELCDQHMIAVVIADHHMQPTTGIEILGDLSNKHPEIRRILITGDKSTDLILDAINSGRIHGFFHKPVDFSELKDKILEHITHFQEYHKKSSETDVLKEEIIKLREALYQRNSRIYHTFQSLQVSKGGDLQNKITNLFINKLAEIDSMWDSRDNEANIESIILRLDELQILSEEFNTHCFTRWIKTLQLSMQVYTNNFEFLENKLSDLRKNVRGREGKCYEELWQTLDELIVNSRSIQASYRSSNQIVSLISETIKKLNLMLVSSDLVTPESQTMDNLINGLGYILVVIKQVTVFSREFNPKSEVNPSLIGNMAIALNDFTKELFDDFEGVQVMEQENGIMIIHRADEHIYYVAMAYNESQLYRIWLQEFARASLEFFQSKQNEASYEQEEMQNVDAMLNKIIYSD